jgi:hypothetical protein
MRTLYVTSKRPVASELLEQSGTSPVFGQSRLRVLAAGQAPLDAAQESAEVRDDLSLEVLDMLVAIAKIHGAADYVAPILRASLDGLAPPDRV